MHKGFHSVIAAASIYLFLLAGCSSKNNIDSFSSDGCSLCPDGTLSQKRLWYHCCYNHDIDYWHGGTAEERKSSDETLRSCIAATGKTITADIIYYGVRLGGSPYIPTWFRWGFGWPYLRGYKTLSKTEQLEVEKLKPEKVQPFQ